MPDLLQPEFRLGFAALAAMIPDVVGRPLEEEHWDGAGDQIQATLMPNGCHGLMVWRRADNWTAFTDGFRTWINGPLGLQVRLNTELFLWEMEAQGPQVLDISKSLPTAPSHQLDIRTASNIGMLVVHWDGDAPIPDDYDPYTRCVWEARYHIAKNWASTGEPPAYGYGLMYSEVIARDGRVFITRPVEHVVWAQCLANRIGYAIKVDASKVSPPTDAQKRSLRCRLDACCVEFSLGNGDVFGHGELTAYGNSTECCGPDLLALVRDYRAGK
jgi:hypothetical protein